MTKLEQLAKLEDCSIEDLLAGAVFGDQAIGICTNPDCDYTTSVEPDQTRGYCEVCNTKTVKSCLILAGEML